MASASVLAYPQPAGHAGFPQPSYSTQFPDFNASSHTSPAASPLAHGFPRYDAPRIPNRSYNDKTSFGAVSAAHTAGGYPRFTKATPRSKTSASRGSFKRTKTPPPPPRPKEAKSPSSKTSAAKDRFRSNLKKVAQQKEDLSTTLDLSMTAEENERRTGIPIYGQEKAARSLTELNFQGPTRSRNNTGGYGSDCGSSFKPSAPIFSPPPATSRPQTPLSTYHSHGNSMDNSDQSSDLPQTARQTPAFDSQRPPLRINTSTEMESVSSFTRPRRYTNQSSASASASASASKPRKSLDKAFSIVTRKDSNTTEEMMSPAVRSASIQAARAAFEERQEKKDAKYAKRAARDRERQENRSGKSSSRARTGSSLAHLNTTPDMTEKVPERVQAMAYDDLPPTSAESRPSTGPSPTFQRTKSARKSRYARFMSWLRSKLFEW